MPLRLRITTADVSVALDMLSNNGHLSAGTEIELPGGARMRFEGAEKVAKGNQPGTLEFRLDDAVDGVHADPEPAADWLYEHLHGRVDEVRIGGAQVPVERDALRQALSRGL